MILINVSDCDDSCQGCNVNAITECVKCADGYQSESDPAPYTTCTGKKISLISTTEAKSLQSYYYVPNDFGAAQT